LFDFNENIYNQFITISYVDKLRDEMKFDGLPALKNQLEKDKLHAIEKLAAAS
jgi:riboflavin kinase/FMN adenylyltransferase